MGGSMTEKEAVKMLRALSKSDDTEAAHWSADVVLCDLLKSLGCVKAVKAFGAIGKWYA